MDQRCDRTRRGVTSYIVIPARLHSTRLPQKLLLRDTGKSLLQHTYESACLATRPSGICVAADSKQIAREVKRFGGSVRMTDAHAASGTDRVAEVARELADVDVIVNVQGDEPELSGEAIDLVVELLEVNASAVMSTLSTPIRCRHQLNDPACVKVVFDASGRALYFSRSPIPHVRDGDIDSVLAANPPSFYLHIGLYAYRREFLIRLAHSPRSRLEQLERLEQLRVLSNGYEVQVATIDEATVGIDTREDYEAFVARTRRLRKSA